MASILITKKDHIADFEAPLQAEGHTVIAVNFLEYRQVIFEKVPDVDCLFFYSRKGVEFFFERVEEKEITLPKNVKFATLGANTAKTLRNYVEQVDFVGEGQPGITFNAFKKWFSGDTVLAVRADNSLNRLRQVTGVDWKLLDLVVYSNEIKESVNFEEHDIAVLTSPLNAKAYFKFQNPPYPCLVAIGQTTATAIQTLENEVCFVSPEPYLDKVALYVQDLIQNRLSNTLEAE
jgi:uroporphyrinogen-III synthase